MIEPANLLRKLADQSAAPIVMTLATVASDGSPRARSVVCRRIDDDFSLWFTTDSRSAKGKQLRAVPAAEAVWWLSDVRQQFRFRGAVEIFDEAHSSGQRESFWKQFSDESRAMFFWPAPGSLKTTDPGAFPRAVSRDQSPPATFELLALRGSEIEHLDLSCTPHDRRLWRAADGWRCEQLNP